MAGSDAGEIIHDASAEERTVTPALVATMVATGLVGAVASFTLSSVLYSLVTSAFFAVGTAITLLLAASVIFHKAGALQSRNRPELLLVFRLYAVVGVTAAAFTIFLCFGRLTGLLDAAMLITISAALCFALATFVCEFYNRFFGASSAAGTAGTTLLNPRQELCGRQVYAIVAATVLLGGINGFLFGAVDVEDSLTRVGGEQIAGAVCGFVAGAVLGFVNFFAKDESLEIRFEPLPMTD